MIHLNALRFFIMSKACTHSAHVCTPETLFPEDDTGDLSFGMSMGGGAVPVCEGATGVGAGSGAGAGLGGGGAGAGGAGAGAGGAAGAGTGGGAGGAACAGAPPSAPANFSATSARSPSVRPRSPITSASASASATAFSHDMAAKGGGGGAPAARCGCVARACARLPSDHFRTAGRAPRPRARSKPIALALDAKLWTKMGSIMWRARVGWPA